MADTELYRSQRLLVREVGQGGSVCFVTFGSYTRDPTLERPGFGEEFFRSEGISAIHVLSIDNRWFQYGETPAALAAIAAAASRFERVVTYGSSMGGYAALRFARVCGADQTIAISPQFTCDPRSPPFDTRWASDMRRIRVKEGPYLPAKSPVIVYDPTVGLDRRHAELFLACGPGVALPIHHCGHSAGALLAETGVLQQLVRSAAIACAVDPVATARAVRAARRDLAHYHFVLARLVRERRPQLATALLRRAIGMKRESHLVSALAAILDEQTHYDEAGPLHHEALALAPRNTRAITNYALHLIQRGAWCEARRLVAEATADGHILPNTGLRGVRRRLVLHRLGLDWAYAVARRLSPPRRGGRSVPIGDSLQLE